MNSIKVLTMAGLMLVSAQAIAQKSKVNSADRHREDHEYQKAISEIEEAAVNADTKDKAKTWYVRGQVYKQICLDTSKAVKALNIADPAMEAMKSFKRALELKADKDYTKDIQEEYMYLANGIFREGANAYNLALEAKDSATGAKYYKQAISRFDLFDEAYTNSGPKSADLDKLFEKNRMNILDPKYFDAVSYERVGDRAKAKKLMIEIAAKKYPKVLLYTILAGMYTDDKQYDEAIKLLDDAGTFLPQEAKKDLLIDKLQVYITSGRKNESIEVGKKALAADPGNVDIYVALASNYEGLGMDKEADDMYKQAVAKDPEGFKTNFAVGLSLYNKGAKIYQTSQKEKDYRKQGPIIEEAKKVWRQAMPYLEKAAVAKDNNNARNRENLREDYRLLKLIYSQFDEYQTEFLKYNKLYKEFDQKR